MQTIKKLSQKEVEAACREYVESRVSGGNVISVSVERYDNGDAHPDYEIRATVTLDD